jgi:hypothetical protein
MQKLAQGTGIGKLTRSQPPPMPGLADPLAAQLSRLGNLLDEEVSILKAGQLAELPSLTQRKIMMLLQLGNQPPNSGRPPSSKVLGELELVRGKLARNLATLQLNIRALGELNDLLAERYRDADSDGTYSMYKR